MFLNYDRYSLLQKQEFFGWLIKAKVKAHYRKLPNGKVIRIEEYFDKRTAAKKDPKKFRGHVVHVDDKKTTIVNSKGEIVEHEHDPRKHELTKDHIHGELNRAVPIDDSLAERMVLSHLGIDKDSDEYEQILNELSDTWDGKGEKPEPEDIFSKKYVKPLLKKLQKQFGESSSLAEMYQNGDETREFLDHLADSDHDDYHGKALAKMAQDHSESAIDELAKQQSAVEKAQALTKKDCPKIANLDPKLKLFGHQAEVLAKLNVLQKAIVDVDMGGGKGLLLPADAMNLMAQGKVKKPLIIAPTNTVEQNALKVINEYGAGSVNVFKITNQTINDVYDGDVEKMVEDIHNAPPNTIFVAGYDAFSYQKRGDDGKVDRGQDQFERARTLSSANFDYVACFPAGTRVMTADGYKPIEQIKTGDTVLCAKGWETVKATQSKYVDREVTIRLSNGVEVTSSDNHPYFTESGWKRADQIRSSERIITAAEAMRILRKGLFSSKAISAQEQVLFKIMFLEIHADKTWIQGSSSTRMGEDANRTTGEIQKDISGAFGTNESQSGKDVSSEEQGDIKTGISTSFSPSSWREWIRANSAGDVNIGSIGGRMGMELSSLNGNGTRERCISDLLQDGFSASEIDDLCGTGWTKSQQQERSGYEKGRFSNPARVESVEIKERDGERKHAGMPFYDLTIDGHPSFVVEGLLVHNCDESHNIKNLQSNRWKSLQYLTSAKYKRLASGTFVSNNPRDVIGQLKWLHPSASLAEDKFKEKYGYEESSEGVRWSEDGLKQLREDMNDMGLISIRRSGWIHLLPQRDEAVSISKMDKSMNAIHETCVTGILDHLEKEIMENPRFRKRIEAGEDIDDLIEASPKFQNALNILGGLTDYPSEMAKMINQSVKLVLAAKKKQDEGDEDEEASEDEELLAAQELLRKLPAPIRKAIQGLDGTVSPKALDCYEKMREHMKNPKNGKFIVMTQRKLSCQHILDNMPEDLKKHAMYYDASQAHRLKEFTDDDGGPKILVAVDASITEGINMQKANGLYRYDHKYSPGAQEQSYARVWRFGQNKPVKIYNGIVDNGVDVTKYCRMMTKHHQNMLATSELPKTPTDVAYKLSLENIRNNRSASIVPKYEDMGKSIIDFQKQENVPLRKRFGDAPESYSGEATIGGKNAKPMHGSGAYQTEYTGSDKSAHLDDKQLDDMVGHVRDSIRKHLDSVGYDTEVWQTILPAAIELAERHKMKGGMDKDLDESTWDSFVRENDHYDDTEKEIILHAVNKLSKGKKHKGHADDPDEAVRTVLNDLELPVNEEAHGAAIEDVESLRKWMKKKGVKMDYEGIGSKVANSKDMDEFWQWWEKKFDDKQSKTYRNIIESAAGLLSHHEGGWSTMKDQMGMFLKGKRSA